LFPNDAPKKNLLEFRAGKMYRDQKMICPDKRKGLVFLHVVILPLILFPLSKIWLPFLLISYILISFHFLFTFKKK
jgi:hypothetical protein